MKQFYLSLIFCIIIFSISFGQGIIRGKITDENGETVIGASINLKSNNAIRTMTDFDGNYSLKIPVATPQTMVITFIGYKPTEETVNPKDGEIIVKNISLVPVSQALKEVEIVATAVKAKDNFMVNVKKKSPTLIDYISAESIKRIGDVNVSSAVARVVGVSTNGAFITVRGIGDRYVKTAINGSRIPTLDPFTNNIKLDLFPASLVDNIIITKTASPDLPGDWAGAYLSVETKDYPEKLAINVETSFGYNEQTTFKDVVSSQRSSTDWLGYDKSLREYNNADFINMPNLSAIPTQYQQFVALGLGSYYNSLGITNNVTWNDTYTKLGFIKLGLLSGSQINDIVAFHNAQNEYQKEYYNKAYDIIYSAAAKSNQAFPNTWLTNTRKAPLNYSQSFSIGNQTNLFGRPLGYIAGFRYSSAIQYDPNSTANTIKEISPRGVVFYDTLNRKTSKETNGWSALVNLAYKYSHNHSLSLLFMPNIIGVNNVQNGTDFQPQTSDESGLRLKNQKQFYESRKQIVYQLKSEHYIPGPKLKIELNASYTKGTSNAPDFKSLDVDLGTGEIAGLEHDRYFRYLTENLFDSRLSAELPLGNKPDLVRKIKIGGAYQNDYRTNDQYDYQLKADGSTNVETLNPDQFGITSINGIHTIQNFYEELNLPSNHCFGKSYIKSGYMMLDYTIIPALRVSGGLRVEHAYTYTDVKLYDSLGLAPDDPRRVEVASSNATFYPQPGVLNKTSYLPSANLIYKIKNNERAPMNLRLNYSQTVARPSIRELTDTRVYDYELRSDVVGNPNLKMVQITNYDLRFETYFKNGDNVSLSVFYKEFKNHIELFNLGDLLGYQWWNNDYKKSWVKGVEIEGKKTIGKHFELRANVTLDDSRSIVIVRKQGPDGISAIPIDTVSHRMFGQAPFIVNGILAYNSDSLGLTIALSYNIQGSRLVIESGLGDIYEMPRNLLDLKISKTIGKHFSASLKVLDILRSSIRRAYKLDNGFSLDYDKYTYGTTYVFSLSYKF